MSVKILAGIIAAIVIAGILIPFDCNKTIDSFQVPTKGAHIDSNGKITITTDLDGNRFSYVAIQLYTLEYSNFIQNITTSGLGRNSGVYTHKKATDSYIVRLKANSNMQDEGVEMRVLLVEGESYFFSYDVTVLQDNYVVIENYSFRYAFR